MAIVSIYDLDGKEHKRETVDARELEELGWTREPKQTPVEGEAKRQYKKRDAE